MRTGGGIIDATNRHAVFAEGHKTQLAKGFQSYLLQIARDVRRRLGGKDLTEYSNERFELLYDHIRDDVTGVYRDYYRTLREQLVDFAAHESGFESRLLQRVVGVEFDLPTRAQLRAAVLSTPLVSLQGPDKAQLLRGFFANHSERQINIITGAVKAGYYQGTPTTDIIRQIVGTQGMRYNDGLLAKAQREIYTMVRTAAQHAATVAREEVYKENDDIVTGWQFLATLDDRTSTACQALDGTTWPLGEGPRPPIHPNCRSTTIPALHPDFAFLGKDATRIANGEDGVKIVPANQTYYEWVQTQSPEFQDAALGKTRAELLRSGELSADKFARLNMGPGHQARTLAELQKLDDADLNRAFGKIDLHLNGANSKLRYDVEDAAMVGRLQQQSNEVWQDLNKAERRAIKDYTVTGYIVINDELRSGTYANTPKIERGVRSIDSAINKFEVKENIVVFRGDDSKYYGGWDVGSVYSRSEFLSTSASKEFAQEWADGKNEGSYRGGLLIEINAPKGTRGMYLGLNSGAAVDEREFLLGRDQKYKVIDRTKNTMKLEVVHE